MLKSIAGKPSFATARQLSFFEKMKIAMTRPMMCMRPASKKPFEKMYAASPAWFASCAGM